MWTSHFDMADPFEALEDAVEVVLDRAQVDEFGGHFAYLTPAKAERDLGWTYRPAREAIRRTVAWLLDRGFVDEPRRRALSPDPALADVY